MAQRKKLNSERKAFINSLLKHYKPKDALSGNDECHKK